MKNELALYLVMVTYKREESAKRIILDFIKAKKPSKKTYFIVVDNFKESKLEEMLMDSGLLKHIHYLKVDNPNKSAAINYAIKSCVTDENALIINIDNDIKFNNDFLIKYYNAAKRLGHNYYFGGSFYVNFPNTFNKTLIKYYQGSALGKPDEEFLKMKNLMFLGFNYAFFKSQWLKLNGLDERFGPGSKYNIGGEESVFQKKMKFFGFKPYFIEDNKVEHKPEASNYLKKNVLKRTRNNGLTHGYQMIVNSKKLLKYDYWIRIGGMTKSIIFDVFNNKCLQLQFKKQYALGYLQAFIVYLKEENKHSIYRIEKTS